MDNFWWGCVAVFGLGSGLAGGECGRGYVGWWRRKWFGAEYK